MTINASTVVNPWVVLIVVAALGLAPHMLTGAEPAFYGFLLPFLVVAYTAAAHLESSKAMAVPAVGAGVFGRHTRPAATNSGR